MNTALAMRETATRPIVIDPLFVRHDLLIEMGRLEMELEHDAPQQDSAAEPLRQRMRKVAHILRHLPA